MSVRCIAIRIIAAAVLVLSLVGAASAAIRLEKFAEYKSDFYGCKAEIITPRVKGLSLKEEEDAINEELSLYSLEAIKDYGEKALGALKDADASADLSVEVSCSIKADNDKCIAFDICRSDTFGSGSETHRIYTFSKKTGRAITLKDLFNEKVDYIKLISEYLVREMRRRNVKEGKAVYLLADDGVSDGFSAIRHDQNFYIGSNGTIVICFDKYEAATGAMGTPEIEIPRGVIDDRLKEDVE
ncbi:MAG: RsiV family protein [Synergistes sp.]|nr:RsiV family protein [Synergistes sp.]